MLSLVVDANVVKDFAKTVAATTNLMLIQCEYKCFSNAIVVVVVVVVDVERGERTEKRLEKTSWQF
jgi:hypothetical protein